MSKRQIVGEGDRLVSIAFPPPGGSHFQAGKDGVLSIGVAELPGPMGAYLVANVVFENDDPDLVAPLHLLECFEVLNP